MTPTDSINLKEKQVKDLAEEIKKAKTLMIVSIKSLPSKQFQEIKKSVREYAKVKVAKKNIMLRALKSVGKESILGLNSHVTADCAFAISDMEGYELAGVLAKKKTPVFAKAGQEAPEDIEVKAGPTDLVPGPAISELGALGIQIAVEDGKISIKTDRVVVKKGATINEATASILQKLNIQPFNIGLNPVSVYDVENEKIYTDVKVDSEEATEVLVDSAGKALGFAQKIIYYCKETIGYFLGKADMEGKALDKLGGEDEKVEEVKERDSTTPESDDEDKSNIIEDEGSEGGGDGDEVKDEVVEEKPVEEVKEEGVEENVEVKEENKEEEKDG